MKAILDNLMIEVTRRCNMSCEHCLRGCSENIDLNTDYIVSLLNQIESINSVTFTGGEPSLNVQAIDYFLEKCKEKDIYIGSFYIATNGFAINENFVLACLKLYSYCSDKECCQVHVSNDYFHANEGCYSTELLDGLSFFSRKHEKEASYNIGLINEGFYAENYGDGRENKQYGFEVDDNMVNDGEVYLNCEGNIISGCDWSYESQRNKKNIVCNVKDNILESIKNFIY